MNRQKIKIAVVSLIFALIITILIRIDRSYDTNRIYESKTETEICCVEFSYDPSITLLSGISKVMANYENYLVEVVTTKEEIVDAKTKIQKKKLGYIIENVNIRKKPSTKSKILDTFSYGDKISYYDYNKKWATVKYKGEFAYVRKKYISKKKPSLDIKNTLSVPSYSGYKSWMPYTAITSTSSPQYKLQHQYAYTGNYGVRMVNDRYCVALGSYFEYKIGQYFDLVLKNGSVIKCVMSDQKADEHTDEDNIFTIQSDSLCMSEFIIDRSELDSNAKNMGDVSYCCDDWRSPVVEVIIYKKNIFD